MSSESKRSKSERELVQVDGERVRDAIGKYRGVSIRSAAAAIGVNQSTLSAIVNKKTDRCRRWVRLAIAEYVGLPDGERFLAGKSDSLPWISRFTRFPPKGEEIRPLDPMPSRAEAAAHRVAVRVLDAFERDIENDIAHPPATWKILASSWSSEFERRRIIATAINDLLNPALFRSVVMPAEEPTMSEGNAETITSGLADALEAVLRPWLEGESAIDYSWFYKTLERALRGKPTWFTR